MYAPFSLRIQVIEMLEYGIINCKGIQFSEFYHKYFKLQGQGKEHDSGFTSHEKIWTKYSS